MGASSRLERRARRSGKRICSRARTFKIFYENFLVASGRPVEASGMTSLGDRIRNRRAELNWTLAVLEKESGVSKGFLSDLENGKKKTAGSEHLRKIARALGVSADYLISGSGPLQEAPVSLQIPTSLARFAQQEGLSFSHTAMLLQLRRQILAFRSDTKSEDIEEFDWKPFYEAVKAHLK